MTKTELLSIGDELFEIFEIQFDAGPTPTFHGGELITGSVRVNLKRPIIIKEIKLQFKGRAVYLGNLKHSSKKFIIPSENEKIYFDKDIVLLERPPGHEEIGNFKWNANYTYSLPFECRLPRGCETSYENPSAFIRYFVRVSFVVDSEPVQQYYVKKAFSVVSPPDLNNLIPPQSEPIVHDQTFRFGACCCVGKIRAELLLPKSSYAPGENIVGTITVTNQNARNVVDSIEVRFVDRVSLIEQQHMTAATTTTTIPDVNGDENKAQNSSHETHPFNSASIEAPKEKLRKRKVIKPKSMSTEEMQQVMSKKSSKKSPKLSASKLEHRVIETRRLDKEYFIDKSSKPVTQNVLFMTVPPVPPTTFDNLQTSITSFSDSSIPSGLESLPLINDNKMEESQQFSKLLESPSTITLRQRKQPFIRVHYALQISIGSKLLLEVPIQIHPIPLYDKGIFFRGFGAGPQFITDPDELNGIPFHGPFTFQPQYPVYVDSPIIVINEVVNEENGEEEVGTCAHVIAHETEEKDTPLGVEMLSRTIETVTLPDGTEVINRREERTIMETIVTSTPLETNEQPQIDSNGSIPVESSIDASSSETTEMKSPTIIISEDNRALSDSQSDPSAQTSPSAPLQRDVEISHSGIQQNGYVDVNT